MITSIDNIRKACLDIAYDSGMINRYHSEEEILSEMVQRVEKNFSIGEISLVEEELSCLDEHMFQQALEGNGISYLATDLLNVAFDGVE